ncbi:MAG TPA: efflux RND transporter periplasmic adaptor subunit [Hyphomicrobium sp.]|nr:efflux RND transporter periplasmic adaptor subunit [Hyphomicrobium sp.]
MRKDLATRLRLAGAAILTACFAPPSFAQAPPEPPPPSVVVETVRPHDVTDQSTYLGRVEAIDKVTIRARVDGFLASRGFDEGSEVKKDQILFTLEKEPYEAAVALARANLASARAGLDLAQATYDRTRPLAERGTSSQAALDDAAAKLSQARATVQAQEAMLRQAELNLSYTEIRAPMDGRTGRATYAVGEYVGPSSNPLVNLVRQDPMYVAFPVPQRVLLEVRREGVTADQVLVRLSLPDGSTYQHDGAIKFIDVESNRGTDTTMVRAEMPNPERLLVDQQIVRVNVVSKETDHRLMISQAAIVLDQEGSYVLAVSAEKKVEIRRIEVGAQHGARIEVRKGLSEGDRVIVSGHQKVRPGIVVEPSEAVNDAMLQETSGQAAP